MKPATKIGNFDGNSRDFGYCPKDLIISNKPEQESK